MISRHSTPDRDDISTAMSAITTAATIATRSTTRRMAGDRSATVRHGIGGTGGARGARRAGGAMTGFSAVTGRAAAQRRRAPGGGVVGGADSRSLIRCRTIPAARSRARSRGHSVRRLRATVGAAGPRAERRAQEPPAPRAASDSARSGRRPIRRPARRAAQRGGGASSTGGGRRGQRLLGDGLADRRWRGIAGGTGLRRSRRLGGRSGRGARFGGRGSPFGVISRLTAIDTDTTNVTAPATNIASGPA